jgi:hypothetical protein
MSDWYDREGRPISMDRWALKLSFDKHVAKTQVGQALLSTVWLGLDHRFQELDPGPPLIFETMVFGGPLDQLTRRYSTLEEAQKGHAEIVAQQPLNWFTRLIAKWTRDR